MMWWNLPLLCQDTPDWVKLIGDQLTVANRREHPATSWAPITDPELVHNLHHTLHIWNMTIYF